MNVLQYVNLSRYLKRDKLTSNQRVLICYYFGLWWKMTETEKENIYIIKFLIINIVCNVVSDLYV